MEMLQRSKLANIFLLAFFLTLLFLTPFISPSMRHSYLYFLLNLLIIVLGAEAGFLSAISKPRDEKKPASVVICPSTVSATTSRATDVIPIIMEKPSQAAGVKKEEEGSFGSVNSARAQGLKRCKSRPSLFFIGSCEEEEVIETAEEKERVVGMRKKVVEDVGELSKQELFMKAEMFIGNFYKQLKMQREKSWQKLHGLYHKAF